MACRGSQILARTPRDLCVVVLLPLTALLLHAVPGAASGSVPGRYRSGNPDEARPVEKGAPATNDVREEMMDPAQSEANVVGHGPGTSFPWQVEQLARDREIGRVSEAAPWHGMQAARSLTPPFMDRKIRRSSKLHSLDNTAVVHRPPPRSWAGTGCSQPPPNPTVVVGIVGGAVTFFLVVVLTIVYCSYRNHPPADTRKRLAEMYAYMRGLEEVWVGVASPATNFKTECVKHHDYGKIGKGHVIA
ncbi:uncharacterized protein LOC110973791 [Acanthaster planci]|uniref:Uncharacterized protein LOC110973791 n=1 Tax=Acanthaster planci TaxID=133434 RepID=A0A8B7XKB7_ACAPL|nr:uncharacterized protein LOC110973791 [Acanthaster planci]